MSYDACGCKYGSATIFHVGERSRVVHLHLMRSSPSCQTMCLAIRKIKQRYTCGCGLAALEMVLRYYGATDAEVDFLADEQIGGEVSYAERGLSEGTLGTLALKRGFYVEVRGENPSLTRIYFKLGGRVDRAKTSKCSILKCLRRGIPCIVLIPSVKEAYEFESDEVGHYVVATGVDSKCRLQIVDPEYAYPPKQQYWNSWSSSLIEVVPRQ